MTSSSSTLWSAMLPFSLHGHDDLCAVSARGVRVSFADGRQLLDGTSGLWNVNLGYGNEAIASAIGEALRDASYLGVHQCENAYAREAAQALVELAGPRHFGRVLYSTSGGAANDLVMKLVRQYHVLGEDRRRNGIVALEGSWHGLTYGAFALTGQELGQRTYAIDRRLVLHVPPNDADALTKLLEEHGDRIGAVIVEPVIGTGAVALTQEYVARLIDLRKTYKYLLVADEVATGFGRTGNYFASDTWAERPDILITSKGLTNGTCATAAVLVSRDVVSVFRDADAVVAHAETQAGTPPSCAAMIATMAEMGRLGAVAAAARLGERLDKELHALVEREPLVAATTGLGCFRSIRLLNREGQPLVSSQVPAVVDAVRAVGAIVHAAPDGVQILPALVYTDDELDELLSCIQAGLVAYARS